MIGEGVSYLADYLTFWGVKGAEVSLREVGDEYPPYRNLFILKKR